jgi:homoserine kinase type II
MAYYTNITLSEANIILNLYDLPKVKTLTPIGHGISNSNYIANLEDGQEIILKISNDKNDQQLLAEQYILLNLNHLGFPYSPVPILTKKNLPVYISKPYYGVLFPRLKGQVPVPSASVCHNIGSSLAKLHVQTESKKLHHLPYPLRDAVDVSYFPQDLVDFCSDPQCPDDFKKSVYTHLPDDLLAFFMSVESQLPTSILHGDLYFDNTLFLNNELVGMLDFEQAGLGPCLFDIGVSISGTCLKDKKIEPEFVLNFLEGYQSVRKLSATEVELLPMHILCGFLSISLWRIYRFYLGNLSSARKMSYQELLKMADVTAQILNPSWCEKFLKAGL